MVIPKNEKAPVPSNGTNVGMCPPMNGKTKRRVNKLPIEIITLVNIRGNLPMMCNIQKEKEPPPYNVEGLVLTPLLAVDARGMMAMLDILEMGDIVLGIGLVNMGGMNHPPEKVEVGV
jgi:hypothetical protein